MELHLFDEHFILDASRALYHVESQSIIIADVHLGKSTHFRKNGIPIPVDVAENDLKRLSNIIDKYQPQQVIIAGDFFHASANSEVELFKLWRSNYPMIQFLLIKGNHDCLKNSLYDEMDITIIPKILEFDNFQITHHPIKSPSKFSICGHIHPGINIKLNSRQRVRLPCFLLQEKQLILPAFSEFTGLDTSLQNSGRNLAITTTEVIEIY